MRHGLRLLIVLSVSMLLSPGAFAQAKESDENELKPCEDCQEERLTFEGVPWDAKPAYVRAKYGEPDSGEAGEMVYERDVLDHSAEVTFDFRQEILANIRVSFYPDEDKSPRSGAKHILNSFEDVASSLRSSHGKPVETARERWDYRPNEDLVDAIGLGKVLFWDTWESADGSVRMKNILNSTGRGHTVSFRHKHNTDVGTEAFLREILSAAEPFEECAWDGSSDPQRISATFIVGVGPDEALFAIHTSSASQDDGSSTSSPPEGFVTCMEEVIESHKVNRSMIEASSIRFTYRFDVDPDDYPRSKE